MSFHRKTDQAADRAHGRRISVDKDGEHASPARQLPPPVNVGHRTPRRKDSIQHPKPPLTPSTSVPQSINNPLIPSAPASPPTPAPSPTPHQRVPVWQPPLDDEDPIFKDARLRFRDASAHEKEMFLASLIDDCDNHTLSFLHHLVSPRLKKDPFRVLPNELCFRILEFVDDATTFTRAAQVSRRWREIMSDDQAWKTLSDKFGYRRMSTDSVGSSFNAAGINPSQLLFGQFQRSSSPVRWSENMTAIAESSDTEHPRNPNIGLLTRQSRRERPRSAQTHRSQFKHRYMVDAAWRRGGHFTARHISPDQGVVTSLHLTKKYIIVALDNARIHVFNTKGDIQRTLQGHVMGVWAMIPWDDILVSGGCDRDVRVWNMATGASVYTLRGHTSTVRCLKMSNDHTAISGSRDTTLRIWNLATGQCTRVLSGHQASVRCLEIHGDLVVSGSYDTQAKIWRISTGEFLRTLAGHFSQIYAIAFDGHRIATGSLDTSVRIWSPDDGQCLAILQGHTSLVGQLQMSSNTLVTGGSDGSVRVWSLETFTPIHRLAAHDNSVTSLQFDEHRIVSGGSDGRVKVWDLQAGTLIRELIQPAEAVWRVAFESETAVVMASRNNRTIMEVWDFRPQEGSSGTSEEVDQIMTDVHEPLGRARSVDAAADAYATDLTIGDARSEGNDRMNM